ncbi:hypothetical protein XpopCFBP1817_02575 [Xanthomonas populi]|uniref:Uncharacterized protein n=1 Tax=Xanthomonas populi TaxID=53414 RepID=A0A2S7F259_9XANT|nr:hypothetical protein XpopCFBP1817_02575 [Xanthomonas populi]
MTPASDTLEDIGLSVAGPLRGRIDGAADGDRIGPRLAQPEYCPLVWAEVQARGVERCMRVDVDTLVWMLGCRR